MTCDHCHEWVPRAYLLPASRRWLCGVCVHRLRAAQDLARRIARHQQQLAA